MNKTNSSFILLVLFFVQFGISFASTSQGFSSDCLTEGTWNSGQGSSVQITSNATLGTYLFGWTVTLS